MSAQKQALAEPWVDQPKCGYCGRKGDFRHHSGVRECGECWDWRKLDGPAARHWNEVAAQFLSNIDLYDQSAFFPRVLGMDTGEWLPMLKNARQVYDRTGQLIAYRTYATNIATTLNREEAS